MPEKNNHAHGDGCGCGGTGGNCGGCGCSSGHGGMCGCAPWGAPRRHILKVLIILAIIAITFWLGVKIGEFKARVEQEFYGYRMMGRGSGPGGYLYGSGMMRGWGWDGATATTTP